MEVDALLCDHAAVAEGKLYISGGAIDTVWTGPNAPFPISVHVAMVVQVPYTSTNEEHSLTVRLVDEDGRGVVPWSPGVDQELPPVELQSLFTVGRPVILLPGESQLVPFSFGLQVPIAAHGLYHFAISVDDEEVKRLPLRVRMQVQ